MTYDHGTPGTDIIHVTVVIFIDDIGSIALLEENGIAAYAAERPDRGVNPTGDMLLGCLEELV